MWFFAWSTGVSIPVWVEGKYGKRAEADWVLAEPTERYNYSKLFVILTVCRGAYSKLATAFVPERKFKTTASSIKLGWSQRLAGIARPSVPFNELTRQPMIQTSVKSPNLSVIPAAFVT